MNKTKMTSLHLYQLEIEQIKQKVKSLVEQHRIKYLFQAAFLFAEKHL